MNVFKSKWLEGMSFGIPEVVPDEWKMTATARSSTADSTLCTRPTTPGWSESMRLRLLASRAEVVGTLKSGETSGWYSESLIKILALLAVSKTRMTSGENVLLNNCGT